MKKIPVIIAMAILSTSSMASVTLKTDVNSVNVYQGVGFNATSYHIIDIKSGSDASRVYTYTISLCPENKECVTYTRKIKINPHGTFHDERSLGSYITYNMPGVYTTRATTRVDGFEQAQQEVLGRVNVYQR